MGYESGMLTTVRMRVVARRNRAPWPLSRISHVLGARAVARRDMTIWFWKQEVEPYKGARPRSLNYSTFSFIERPYLSLGSKDYCSINFSSFETTYKTYSCRNVLACSVDIFIRNLWDFLASWSLIKLERRIKDQCIGLVFRNIESDCCLDIQNLSSIIVYALKNTSQDCLIFNHKSKL